MNQRHLLGITECLCRTCAPSGGSWRRFVKRDVRRYLRHTAAKQIREEIASDNDHNGDADYMRDQVALNILNVRFMRTNY